MPATATFQTTAGPAGVDFQTVDVYNGFRIVQTTDQGTGGRVWYAVGNFSGCDAIQGPFQTIYAARRWVRMEYWG